MKDTVIFIPVTYVDMGTEDIKSSDTGTSAEGTFASYHPCLSKVLAGNLQAAEVQVPPKRFVKPWKLREWCQKVDSHHDNKSLKTILKKSIGSRLSLSFLYASVILTALKHRQLGRACRGGESLGGLTGGKNCLHCPLILPLEYSSSDEGTLWFKNISLKSSISMGQFGRWNFLAFVRTICFTKSDFFFFFVFFFLPFRYYINVLS